MEEKKEIVLIRLYNGDLIIGEKVQLRPLSCSFDTEYVLDNPRAIAVVPTMTGSVKIAMGTVCEPFRVERLKKRLVISNSQVMFALSEDEIDNELVNGYKSEISGIKIASAADTAAITSARAQNSATGDFIL
jgi:hypothetical protein